MMKNYVLLALKVLGRNKFYTCVSLFSISVTLMVLMLVTSLLDSFMHPRGPEVNSDRLLVAASLLIQQTTVDGSRVASGGPLGYRFIERSILGMKVPEAISIFTGSIELGLPDASGVGFRDGIRIESVVRRTDANYWKILQFDFLEGRPFTQQEHEQGNYVAVISATTREQYFPGETALGKRLTVDRTTYEVVGVVDDVSPLETLASADIWVPIFATASTLFRSQDIGEFRVLLQARTPADIPLIQDEYAAALRNYQPSAQYYRIPDRPLELRSRPLPKVDLYVRLLRPPVNGVENPNASRQLLAMLGGGMLLFMLLPAMNLININVSRILERAPEIGVRKSFGASRGHLLRQFIVENLLITALGGALGFLLALLALALLNGSGLLRGETFAFNYRVFTLGFVYIGVFGVLSAAYPAWRMSRLDPVHALKGVVA